MKILFAALLSLLLPIITSGELVGQRYESITLTDGTKLDRVKISSVLGDQVMLIHSGGAENISIRLLPEELQAAAREYTTKSESSASKDTKSPDLPTVATLALNVFQEDNEAVWRDALAEALGGKTEVSVEGGRVDVLTDQYAIEVDRSKKYHEGVGQALHYAAETGKIGVVALMEDSGEISDHKKQMIFEQLCKPNGLNLLILKPARGSNSGFAATGSGTQNSYTPPSRASTYTPSPQKQATGRYWISSTGKTHRSGCRYYGTTKTGRYSSTGSGDNCMKCGGAG